MANAAKRLTIKTTAPKKPLATKISAQNTALESTLSSLATMNREMQNNHQEIARLRLETGENMAKVRAILDTL